MRTASLSLAGAAALVLASLSSSFASDVNCGIVMKSVKLGRSAQDIADTMMISTADVEKCKKEAAEAPKEGQPAGGEKPAAEKKPEAGAH
ncbi:MAG: hypothetical protein IT294_16925 [Deltaproteobacteria bacterium]|nr:hypothetical protein [Deltaproteobacteria bacterium]